jgi:DNA-binding beta-propeller fold protein YncE
MLAHNKHQNASLSLTTLVAIGLLAAIPMSATTGHLTAPSHSSSFEASTFIANGKTCGGGGDGDVENLAYDPVNHYTYLTNGRDGYIQVLSLDGTCKVMATLFPSGANGASPDPTAAAFNPVNNEVYVTDSGGQVYVLSGIKLVKTIVSGDFDGPTGIAFDPGVGEIAVANSGGNTVTFINGTKVATTIGVGVSPQSFAYDPSQGRFLVTNAGSNDVTSMDATNPTDAADDLAIPVGDEPVGIAFDPSTSKDYIADSESDNVTVISSLGHQYGSVSMPGGEYPNQDVWDQSTLRVYVQESGAGNITEISGMKVTHTIDGPTGAGFTSVAYDDDIDKVLVAEYLSGSVYAYT